MRGAVVVVAAVLAASRLLASYFSCAVMATFPQIVVGERAIGGFRELLEADREGTLTELLAA